MLRRVLFGVFVCALLTTAGSADAQIGLRGEENTISIHSIPETATPGALMHLTLSSSLFDLSSAAIVWYSGEQKIAEGVGLKEVEITAGASGTQQVIRAAVSLDESSLTASITISPARIDLIYESDSYVPPFFRGRALPSAGTNVRFQAIPRFVRADGSVVPVGAITFTWKRNGSVMSAASGKGRSIATLPSPDLFGIDSVSVRAASEDGIFTAESEVRLPSLEPILMLYPDHPLFGIMFHRAIKNRTPIEEKEMTFAAIPYFAEALSPDDKRLRYSWRVNEKGVAADEEKRSEITIDASDSPGDAFIDLFLIHATNLFLSSNGSWSVVFSSPAAGSQNPFLRNE